MEQIKINTEKESLKAILRIAVESDISIYQTYLIVLTAGLNAIKTNLFKTIDDGKQTG